MSSRYDLDVCVGFAAGDPIAADVSARRTKKKFWAMRERVSVRRGCVEAAAESLR